MKKINVGVLVSGGGTNLQAIIDQIKQNKLKHINLKLVISNKENAYALVRAEAAKIKTVIVLRKDFDTQEEFEKRLVSILEEEKCELIILAGFMSILSGYFINKYPNRIINVHPSLIPAFCGKGYYGLKVHKAALNYGVKISGATVHFVNEIPDGGKIILQKSVIVKENDTPETLQKRIMEQAEWKLLPKAIEMVAKQLLFNAKGDSHNV